MKKSHIVLLVVFLVIVLDQWLKIYIKTNFFLEDNIAIFGLEWARLHFTENEGMAFGITMAGEYGKLFLTLFRIIAVGFLGHFIYRLIQSNESTGLLISFTLILAGALGNVIDCVSYGVIFSESVRDFHGNGQLATFMPEAGGYAPLMYGKVVDMLYFPMVNTILPEWVPFWGGERFQFFQFIFNIADAAITTGVISILFFHRSFFKTESEEENKTEGSNDKVSSTVEATVGTVVAPLIHSNPEEAATTEEVTVEEAKSETQKQQDLSEEE